VYSIFPRLKESQRQDATTLSGGEQQMCAIGRGIMSRPKLLMVDELPGTEPSPPMTQITKALPRNRPVPPPAYCSWSCAPRVPDAPSSRCAWTATPPR